MKQVTCQYSYMSGSEYEESIFNQGSLKQLKDDRETVKEIIKYFRIRWRGYESNKITGETRHTFVLSEDWEQALKEEVQMKRIDTRWLSNPHAKPSKELSQHDQDMIQLGWDAAKSMCEEKVKEIFEEIDRRFLIQSVDIGIYPILSWSDIKQKYGGEK